MLRLKSSVQKTFLLLFLLLLVACGGQPALRVDPLPSYDALFETQRGWTGADGAYTVRLSDTETLWLFGDTWWGEIRDGRHENATIVNNSIAIQRGVAPPDATVKFYCSRAPDGMPRAFFRPLDGRGWLWVYHGVLAPDGLYLFFMQMQRTPDQVAFGFETIGAWLAHVSNYRDPPGQWRIVQYRLPWTGFPNAGSTFFGSWVLKRDGFFYVYGIAEEKIYDRLQKFMVLARVPEKGLPDFTQWRFYADGQWISDFTAAMHLCAGMANEYSVSFLADYGKYVALYSQDGISKNIIARFAPAPWGPWGDPVTFYQCPEASQGKDIICYAAKGHPDLTIARDELVVTYVANSTDFYTMAADAQLYRPRFLRVRFTRF